MTPNAVLRLVEKWRAGRGADLRTCANELERAIREDSAWRPIAEMPKDGSYVVGRHLAARPVVIRWHGDRWIDILELQRDPTHGIALPPPPET